MTCPHKEEAMLHLYGEGRPEFMSHLAQCPECSEFVKDSRQVLELYRSPSRDQRPDAVRFDPRPHRKRAWVGLAVAASLVFAVGLLYVSMWNDETSSGGRHRAAPVASAEIWWNVDHDISELTHDSARLPDPRVRMPVRVLYEEEASLILDDRIAELKSQMQKMNDAESF